MWFHFRLGNPAVECHIFGVRVVVTSGLSLNMLSLIRESKRESTKTAADIDCESSIRRHRITRSRVACGIGLASCTAAMLALSIGCSTSSDAGKRSEDDPYKTLNQTNRANEAAARRGSAGTNTASPDTRSVALVAGDPIAWSELSPLLCEAAGGMILEEAALDRLLAKELKSRGLTISDNAVAAERQILEQTLAASGASSGEQTSDIVNRLRTSRGLGDARFAALLRRNAGLRAMVRDDVRVSATDLEIAYQIRYGVRYRTRLILVRSELDAANALARLAGKDGRPPESFAAVAADMSIDPSASRGGAIGLVSPFDPSFPEAVRGMVASLTPSTYSTPLALQQGFAVVTVDEVVPPQTSVTPASVSASLESEVRLVREQAEMTRLATRLLSSISVTPLDPSLNWGWNAWRSQNRQ